MNTIIIANIHREPLVTPHVEMLNPKIAFAADWPFPAIGHYRCYHGHTNALTAYMKDETALVFEDDCIPDSKCKWRGAITVANRLIMERQCEMVCLHGRGFDFLKFRKERRHGFDWLIPITEDRWVLGTLCYVIGRKAAERWIKQDFWLHGTNIDVFVWSNRFNFWMIDPRQFVDMKTTTETLVAERPGPFIHGHGAEGSVLQNPRNTHCVNR